MGSLSPPLFPRDSAMVGVAAAPEAAPPGPGWISTPGGVKLPRWRLPTIPRRQRSAAPRDWAPPILTTLAAAAARPVAGSTLAAPPFPCPTRHSRVTPRWAAREPTPFRYLPRSGRTGPPA